MWGSSLRMGASLLAGLVVVTGLYTALFSSVRAERGQEVMVKAMRIEFTRLRRDTAVAVIEPEKPKLEPTAALPDLPELAIASVSAGTSSLVVTRPGVDTRVALGRPSLAGAGSDRGEIPLVRIEPVYPSRALARGVEGFVRVRFTITTAGGIRDPVVVASEPKGLFDRAALDAVSRWRYNPKVENGTAVERRGVEVKFSFAVEKPA